MPYPAVWDDWQDPARLHASARRAAEDLAWATSCSAQVLARLYGIRERLLLLGQRAGAFRGGRPPQRNSGGA